MSNEITLNKTNLVVKHQHENALVVALQGHVIRDCTDLQVVTQLSICIEKARFDLGLRSDTITADDNELFIDAVLAEVKLFWYTLTLEQIPYVFYYGTRGKYDEGGKVFMTPAAISRWFAQFTVSAERVEAHKILTKLNEPPPPPPPTAEEIEAKRLKFIFDAFEKYKVNSNFNDYNNLVWLAIENYRVIPFDDERKKRIAKQAKENLITRLNNPKGLRQTNLDRSLLKALNEGRGKEDIKIEARKLALCELFNDLAEVDASILDWLKETT